MVVSIDTKGSRSPRYPRVPVMEAVGYARNLYNGAHRSVVDTDTAYRVMGFNGKNGASATALGALRQFGLVDGLRGDVRISEVALKILEPSSRIEYVDALHEAANKPEAYEALHRQFGEDMPRSDEPIRAFLIRSMNFSKSGADDCIASLRETLRQLEHESGTLGSEEIGTPNIGPNATPEQNAEPMVHSAATAFPAATQPTEFIRIPLTKGCIAELRFSGEITDEAVARLLRYIELMKDVWAE